MSAENLLYVLVGLAVMNLFAAMLGLHSGMNYTNSAQRYRRVAGDTVLSCSSASPPACG